MSILFLNICNNKLDKTKMNTLMGNSRMMMWRFSAADAIVLM